MEIALAVEAEVRVVLQGACQSFAVSLNLMVIPLPLGLPCLREQRSQDLGQEKKCTQRGRAF